MRTLLILLKNECLKFSRTNQIRAKQKQAMLGYLLCLLAAALYVFFVCKISAAFSVSNNAETILLSLLVPSAFTCLVFDLAAGILWGGGLAAFDAQMEAQLALPVHLSVFLISKIFVVYVTCTILNGMLLFPAAVLYGAINGCGMLYYILLIADVLVLPIVPCLLGTLAGAQLFRMLKKLSVLTARCRLIIPALLLPVFIAYMFLGFSVSSDTSNISNKLSMQEFLQTADLFLTEASIYRSFSRCVSSLLHNDMITTAAYWLTVPAAGMLILYLLTRFCRRQRNICSIHMNNSCITARRLNPGTSKKSRRNRPLYAFTQRSLKSALAARERRRYFSIPVYFTNTALGLLSASIFVIASVTADEKIRPYIRLAAAYFHIPPSMTDLLYIYAVTILTAMSCTTYACISIEGKQMDLLRSFPIKPEDFFYAKLRLHLSLSLPVTAILNTVLAVSLHFSWPKMLLGYIMPSVFSLWTGTTGYFFNIRFPNFEWDHVTQIVKQSIPAIASMLCGAFSSCGLICLLLHGLSDMLLPGSYFVCAAVGTTACIVKKHLCLENII